MTNAFRTEKKETEMTTIASNPSPEPDHDRDAAAEAEPLIRAEEALAIEIISTDSQKTTIEKPLSIDGILYMWMMLIIGE